MKIKRYQLQQLIETLLYENTGKRVVPSEVRAVLKKLGMSGITSLATDNQANDGLAIILHPPNKRVAYKKEHLEDVDLAFTKLKKAYGDRVVMGTVAKLAGGSAGVKQFDSDSKDERQENKDLFNHIVKVLQERGDFVIFIKFDSDSATSKQS